MLTLAASAFNVAGGHTHRVPLRLRPRARAVLSRTRSLSALATLNAHDSAGVDRTTHATVALHLARARHG
jgi:hypothetical protein